MIKRSYREAKYMKAKNLLNKLKIDFLQKTEEISTSGIGEIDDTDENTTNNNRTLDTYLIYMSKFRWYELEYTNSKEFREYIKEKYSNIKLEDRNIEEETDLDGRDLCQFTHEEIQEMLLYFDIASESSLRSHISVINLYRKVARGKKLIPNSITIEFSPSNEELKSLLNTNRIKQQYISKNELYLLCDQFINAQDSALFLGIYEGIKGMVYENIKKLTMEDINFDANIIQLADGTKLRVSDRLLDLLKETVVEDKYERGNGEGNSKPVRLMETPYIFRNVINKRTDSDLITTQTIQGRIRNLSRRYDYSELTVNNIYRSGMINVIKEDMEKIDRNSIDEYNNDEIRILLEPIYGEMSHNNLQDFTKFFKIIES